MQYYLGFDDLKVGQRVKIKGKTESDGNFAALEISMKAPKDQAEIEGQLQEIDHQNHAVKLLNQQYRLASDTIGVDLLGDTVGLQAFKAGEMVKLKGKYSQSQGFVTEKLKMKETMGFSIEELQGNITAIDSSNKTLNVVGYTVTVSEKTVIEGF